MFSTNHHTKYKAIQAIKAARLKDLETINFDVNQDRPKNENLLLRDQP